MLQSNEMITRLKLLGMYSEMIVNDDLIENDLIVNKLITFFVGEKSQAYTKMIDILSYDTKPSIDYSYKCNGIIIEKCLKNIDNEEDTIKHKILMNYFLLNQSKISDKSLILKPNKM